MTLVELFPTIRIPEKPASWRSLGAPAGLRRHRRRSWEGKAYVDTIDGALVIHANGVSIFAWSPSFDDLMADDWEAVES